MSNFIKITNDAPEGVNRLFLEKLGLSTKRDNDDTIGQFGSGSKFAPIAALRKGMRWINASHDDQGPYIMEYVSYNDGGIDCIGYDYGDGDLKASSFTIDAGTLSWEDDFQIFREAFSNAVDAKTEGLGDYSIEFVDDVELEAGKFSVYITATPGMMAIVDDLDSYFCINRTPIYEDSSLKIFPRLSNDEAIIYYKGVRVHAFADDGSHEPMMFDYEVNNATLNEERRIRDIWDLQHTILENIGSINDVDMIGEILTRAGEATYLEFSSMTYGPSMFGGRADRWTEAWKKHVGENYVVMLPGQSEHEYKVLAKGKAPYYTNKNALYDLLKDLPNVDKIEDVLGEGWELVLASADPEADKRISDAVDLIAATFLPGIEQFRNKIFRIDQESAGARIMGVARGGNIYLAPLAFRDDKTLIGTIVHECDHIVTACGDNAQFRNYADDHIGNLVLAIGSLLEK